VKRVSLYDEQFQPCMRPEDLKDYMFVRDPAFNTSYIYIHGRTNAHKHPSNTHIYIYTYTQTHKHPSNTNRYPSVLKI
jgi:hypothetical protein